MKLLSILSICLVLTLISCDKEDDIPRICDDTTLIGTWIWINTTGGVSGAFITPENAGFTEKLEVSESLWRRYRNDSLVFETPYTLDWYQDSTSHHGSVRRGTHSGIGFDIWNCSLTLTCGFSDCFVALYEREN